MSLSGSCVPSRTSGVAPLAVLFDCSGTTSDQTSTPFHNCEYIHGFGDTTNYRWPATNGSGAWGNSWGDSWWDSWGLDAPNRNVARGPIVAHVFEFPGSYTTSTTILDGTSVVQVSSLIVVDDPDVVYASTRTICFSGVGDFTGAPAGASTVTASTWPVIVTSYAGISTRLLLNRGEIFSGGTAAILNKAGPGTIGAYGTSSLSKPKIRTTVTTNNANILTPSGSGGSVTDWRIMDLDIDGEGDVHRNFVSETSGYSTNQLTFLRCDAHDLGGGIVYSGGIVRSIDLSIVDCTVSRISSTAGTAGSEGFFLNAQRLIVAGNELNDTTGGAAEHLLRVQTCSTGTIAHNILKNAQTGKEMIAIRALSTVPTQFVTIKNNQIETNTYMGIQLDKGGQAQQSAIQDVVIEGNYHYWKSGAGGGVRVLADRVSVRNEIMTMSGALSSASATMADIRGTDAQGNTCADVWMYNNSGYSSTNQATARIAVLAQNNISSLQVRNNVLYVPNFTGTPAVVTDGGTGNQYVSTNNSAVTSDVLFASSQPTVPVDFQLTSSSPLISSGVVTTNVFYDYFEQYRSRVSFDIGAHAWQTSTAPVPTALVQRLLWMYPKLDGIGSGGVFIGDSIR